MFGALCTNRDLGMVPVIQEETTGCGIASVANILGKTYSEMKAVANSMVFLQMIKNYGLRPSMYEVCWLNLT